MNTQNLRPFGSLPPEEQRELSRRGGIASGEKRRYLADLRLAMVETLAGADLATETQEEYRRAIKRYVKEERRKAISKESNATVGFDAEAFRQRLRKLRGKRSCSTVSELCGLNRDSVRRYESGEAMPSLASLIALADFFDVSLDWLCGRR